MAKKPARSSFKRDGKSRVGKAPPGKGKLSRGGNRK